MGLAKSDVIFALLVLNDIAAGGDIEHLDILLWDILAASGWSVGESKQHNLVAVKDGVALSAYDSPLVQRPVDARAQAMPDNVTPLYRKEDEEESEEEPS